MYKRKNLGFTLVELLAVIFVIGIISIIAIPTIERLLKQSQEDLYQSQLVNIITGAKNWSSKNIKILPEEDGEFITITLGQLKIGGFVDKKIRNPKTRKLFPDDMEITIRRVLNNYEYEIEEGSGGLIGDIDYNSPIIILNGSSHEMVEIHEEYIEKGAIAYDPSGNRINEIDITIRLNNNIVESIDTSTLSQYKVTYSVTYNGITNSIIRTVTVKDTVSPILTIPGNIELLVEEVASFDVLKNVSATDNSLKKPIITTSGTLSAIRGTYYITYTATDESGNKTNKTRKIVVIERPTIMVTSYGNATTPYLNGPILKNQIESIEFLTTNIVPSDAIGSWDVSNKQNRIVMAWYYDKDNNGLYELYIGGDGDKVYANPDSQYLFLHLDKVENIDLVNFNTSNVINMSFMFYGASGLISLDLSNFNTSNVTDMSYMFGFASSLTSLDLSNFDTSNVTNMSCMFHNASSLTSLDLSNFDTSKVTDMASMFRKTSSLANLNISSFNTSNVTRMNGMFYEASGLTSLDLSNFDTSKVTIMYEMFRFASNITSLNISSFNTTNVTDVSYMFYGTSKLTTLDFRNATFEKVTQISSVFTNVKSGATIYTKNTTTKTWLQTRLSEAGITGNVIIAS